MDRGGWQATVHEAKRQTGAKEQQQQHMKHVCLCAYVFVCVCIFIYVNVYPWVVEIDGSLTSLVFHETYIYLSTTFSY